MSKYINLNQNFEVDRVKNPNTPSDKDLTLDWMANAMGYGYKNGLSSDNRRLFLSIIRKIEDAKKSDSQYFEVNGVEELFILKGFSQLVCSPQEAMWITLAEDAVKSALSELPK